MTGLLFLVGSLGFLLTKELIGPNDGVSPRQSFFVHVKTSLSEIKSNRNFLYFLSSCDLEFVITLTTLSFYANYATGYYAIPEAIAAGLFVACIYSGSITVNIFLGTMNLLSLKQKFILSKFVSFTALILLAWFPTYTTLFLASFMLGFVRAIRNMVYPPSVKKFAGREDATSYFAFGSILTLPFSAGYPLVFGKALDYLSFLASDAYKIMFSVSALIIVCTLFLALKTDYGIEAKSD